MGNDSVDKVVELSAPLGQLRARPAEHTAHTQQSVARRNKKKSRVILRREGEGGAKDLLATRRLYHRPEPPFAPSSPRPLRVTLTLVIPIDEHIIGRAHF